MNRQESLGFRKSITTYLDNKNKGTNMTTTKTLNEIKANFSEVTTNIIDGMDLYDYNHQCADGDADVIYYSRAKDKYDNATGDQQQKAEDQLNEYGFEFDGMNKLYTQLAFFIVLEEYREQHEQEIKTDIEALEEFTSTDESLLIEGEYLEAIEMLETLNDLV